MNKTIIFFITDWAFGRMKNKYAKVQSQSRIEKHFRLNNATKYTKQRLISVLSLYQTLSCIQLIEIIQLCIE